MISAPTKDQICTWIRKLRIENYNICSKYWSAKKKKKTIMVFL